MAVTLWSACAMGLALACAAPQQSAAQDSPPEKCVFEGVAHDRATRLPIPKVTIRLIPDNGSLAYAGSSNGDGSFRFENIVPGVYRVEALRTGYSSPWVLADKAGQPVSSIRLTPGQTLTGNELLLTPDGSIAGKVIGPDGEPLRSATLTLIVRQWRHGKRVYTGADTSVADDAGVFRFAALAPGRYWIYAARPNSGPLALPIASEPGQPEMRIAGRYYPGAPQLDGAQAIEVHAGEDLGGIDFKLPFAPVHHVTGTYSGGSESSEIGLKARYEGEALAWTGEDASVGTDGKFSFTGVIPGDYLLDRLPLTVAEVDITGLSVPPAKRFELKGRLRVDGGPSQEKLPVLVLCEGSEADAYAAAQCRAQPQSDGSFAIRDLTADHYAFTIANLDTGKDGGFYLKRLTVNGVDVEGAEIDLTGGPVENAEFLLSPAVGGLEGVVAAHDEPAQLTVIMIPERVASGATQPIYAYLDAAGHFQKTDLEPGTYRVFAAPVDDQGIWQNPGFLHRIASRGATIDVTEKHTAKVDLHALRLSDIQQVEERIE